MAHAVLLGGMRIAPWTLLTALVLLYVGTGGAAWRRLAYGDGRWRDRRQQPTRVLEALALQPGAQVADLGAGAGYFTLRLARAVGVAGRVFAVDVDEPALDAVAHRARRAGVANVDTIVARPDDPDLPLAGLDLVFASNVYHHLPDPPAYFRRLAATLRDDGRVAILEHDGSGVFARLFGHATPKATIVEDMARAGFRLAADHPFPPAQSFLVFTRRPETASRVGAVR